MNFKLLTSCIALAFLSSCNGSLNQKTPISAIKIGDSSLIVTETDSQFLKDNIPDIQWASTKVDSVKVENVNTDSTKATIDSTVASSNNNTIKQEGFEINLGNASIYISGVDIVERKKQNPKQSNDLNYILGKSNNIQQLKVVIANAKNISVQQRYQSRAIIKTSLGDLRLDDLGAYTSGWQKISTTNTNANTQFQATGLNNLDFLKVNNTKIRNAVDKELRSQKKSNKDIQKWLKTIVKMRDAKDDPGQIVLSNVQWTISGIETTGKSFKKNIRIDL